MLLKNCSKINNLKILSTQSPLLIFFYLVNTKEEPVAMLLQFLQKYDMNFGKVCISEKVKGAEFHEDTDIYKLLSTKANYIARSNRMISAEEFQQINQYLLSIKMVVLVFYQNKIWNWSRLQPSSVINVCDTTWKSLVQFGF